MVKAARFRRFKLNRRKAQRDPKRKILLICEGKVSEVRYFLELRHVSRACVVEIIGGVGAPEVIAKRAVDERKKRGLIGSGRGAWFQRRDEVWAVFDRDEHAHFNEAVAICNANGIGIARSNPCFEVWLILHAQDFQKPDGRDLVIDHFCRLHPDYEDGKGRNFNFSKLISAIAEAESRAETQLVARSQEGLPFGRPSTTVFELTRRIRKP